MANKTIYVRDEKMWLEAKRLAHASGLSLSALIEKLLRAWVARQGK